MEKSTSYKAGEKFFWQLNQSLLLPGDIDFRWEDYREIVQVSLFSSDNTHHFWLHSLVISNTNLSFQFTPLGDKNETYAFFLPLPKQQYISNSYFRFGL